MLVIATQNGKIWIVQLMFIVLPESEELLNSAKMPWKLIDWLNPENFQREGLKINNIEVCKIRSTLPI